MKVRHRSIPNPTLVQLKEQDDFTPLDLKGSSFYSNNWLVTRPTEGLKTLCSGWLRQYLNLPPWFYEGGREDSKLFKDKGLKKGKSFLA